MNWRLWIYSLMHSVISGCASAGAAMYVAPDTFNLHQWKKTLALVGVGGLTGLFSFLSKSPLPDWNGKDRRVGENADATAAGKRE